jgi:acyl carrier protein
LTVEILLMATAIHQVIEVIKSVGNLPAIGPDEDIYDAGFSSHSALLLVSELEDAFRVTIPDDRFPSARTPRALHGLIEELAS